MRGSEPRLLTQIKINGVILRIFEDDAQKTESEVPDKAEDDDRRVEETDVDLINLDDGNGEGSGVGRHAEDNVNVDDEEEHGEGIPHNLMACINNVSRTLENSPHRVSSLVLGYLKHIPKDRKDYPGISYRDYSAGAHPHLMHNFGAITTFSFYAI